MAYLQMFNFIYAGSEWPDWFGYVVKLVLDFM